MLNITKNLVGERADIRFDLVKAAVCIDDHKPIGLGGSQLKIALPDARKELEFLELDPVWRAAALAALKAP